MTQPFKTMLLVLFPLCIPLLKIGFSFFSAISRKGKQHPHRLGFQPNRSGFRSFPAAFRRLSFCALFSFALKVFPFYPCLLFKIPAISAKNSGFSSKYRESFILFLPFLHPPVMMKIKYTLNSRYIYLLFIMKRWGQVETRAPLFSKENLRRLIVPLMIEQLLTVTVGMADTMMVSAAGEAAISGVSLVDNINLLIINILSALTTAARSSPPNIWARRTAGMPANPPNSFCLPHCSFPSPWRPLPSFSTGDCSL